VFKRIRWMLLGAAAGVGGSMWVERRVRHTVERFLPEQVGSDVRQHLGQLGEALREALREGRQAMAEREEQLRAGLPEGVTPLSPPGRLGPSGRRLVIEAHPLDGDGDALSDRRPARGPGGRPGVRSGRGNHPSELSADRSASVTELHGSTARTDRRVAGPEPASGGPGSGEPASSGAPGGRWGRRRRRG
jgi:hypothetical protein